MLVLQNIPQIEMIYYLSFQTENSASYNVLTENRSLGDLTLIIQIHAGNIWHFLVSFLLSKVSLGFVLPSEDGSTFSI